LPPGHVHQNIFLGNVDINISLRDLNISLSELVKILGDSVMAKNANYGQAGVVGDNGRSDNNTFVQGAPKLDAVDLAQLATALGELRRAIRQADASGEHDVELGELKKAEDAAKAGESGKVAQFLKASGQWALDFATKLGVEVAKDALKSTLGLPKA
jgi:hypothetical protein